MTSERSGRRSGARAVVAVVLGLSLAIGGCTAGTEPAGGSGSIGLLLPEAKTARYEGVDRPSFVAVVERRCPGCEVLHANANQDAAAQLQQAESMLAQGADVLVLDAVDTVAAVSIVKNAEREDVPVIAYDRFIEDPDVDYYVSFDSERVGFLQGTALLRALEERPGDADPPGILLVHGAPTDPNAAALAAGVQRALTGSDVRVLGEYETPDWSPDRAHEWVSGQVAQFGDRVDAVYAANDGTAAGAIAAMKAAGLDPVPPVTGQDGELAAVQRIIAGDQYSTVYKATAQQARTAAELAVRLLRGDRPQTTARIDGVPSLLLTPVSVTVDEVARVIVAGDVHAVDDICTEPYARACADAGLTEGSGM